MPSPETLERFIARVEQNARAEAVEEFYAEHASMRENQHAPRVGRELHAANERKVLARAKAVRSECVRPVFVSGMHRGRATMVWQTMIKRADGKLCAVVTQTQLVIPEAT